MGHAVVGIGVAPVVDADACRAGLDPDWKGCFPLFQLSILCKICAILSKFRKFPGCETALSLANQKDEGGGKMATPTGLEPESSPSFTCVITDI